jgi:hypothetical protein
MEQQTAFDTLKVTLTSAPILTYLDTDPDIIIAMDASDYISNSILSQYDNDNILHPMAYFLKKHSPTEYSYNIYDKELMAIVQAFKEWHPKLQSIINPICLLYDDNYLEYFMITKLFNQH